MKNKINHICEICKKKFAVDKFDCQQRYCSPECWEKHLNQLKGK